jgi:hypothetical protein
LHARRFDRLVKLVSRRGLAAVLAAGFLPGQPADAVQSRESCGGQPTSLTRFCRTAGACERDEDCAAGCACIERRIGCCRKIRRKGGRRPRSRRCVDGLPALYCTPVAAATGQPGQHSVAIPQH